MIGANYYPELLKYVDEDQLPDFFGGPCTEPLHSDPGPWRDFETVEGYKKDDIVGIRKKADGPYGSIFTPLDFEGLPNPLLRDPNNSVIHFNKHKRQYIK